MKGIIYNSYVLPIKIYIKNNYNTFEEVPKELKAKMHYLDITFDECKRC